MLQLYAVLINDLTMYKQIIRPILFQIPAETIHNCIVWLLRGIHYIPGARSLMKAIFAYKHPSLEREVFGIKFPNPVGLAAGFDKNARIYREMAAMGFGFVEIGTVTPKPQYGNAKPRIFRLPEDEALINRMGFPNQGMKNTIKNLRNRPYKTIVGGNLGKNTLTPNESAPADYLKLFRSMYEYVDYFVINVSCPNVSKMTSLQNKDNINEIIKQLVEFRRGQNNYRPILLKISPDLTIQQIDDIITVLSEGGIDGIVATNTSTSREGLHTSPDIVNQIGNGGLSGKPLTKRSVEMVKYIHDKTEGRFPIIGVGGIMTEDDAIAMLKAGACLIQIYSGFIYNGPMFVKRICKRLKAESISCSQKS